MRTTSIIVELPISLPFLRSPERVLRKMHRRFTAHVLWPLFARQLIVSLAMTMLPVALFGQDTPWWQTPYTFQYSVPLTASVQKIPPQVVLNWPPSSSSCTGKFIYRRSPGDNWTSVASLPTDATSYTDTDVSVGQRYEYQIYDPCLFGYGYIISGIEVPLTEFRGTVILIADQTYSSNLSTELAQLEMDLIGDGWRVIYHDVSRSDTPPDIKALIQGDYNADPNNVQAVLLLGHVPVPYSGWIAPDGHGDHRGAWPADVYYGDMIGTWTDTTDYTDYTLYCQYGCSGDPRQINTPGDGKFDQSNVPGIVKLQVGRVDLANMPSFAPKTELDLLRQYLNKDHNYRRALTMVQQRGFVDDSFGSGWGFNFAGEGLRQFAPLVGYSNTTWNTSSEYFGPLSTQSYVWSYGAGPGWFQGASGVGQTSDFATHDPKAVFTELFGSYFGDWDVPDNFLRAPLATTTYGLTCAWAGYNGTRWLVHHMGLGETIGYSARITQNNNAENFCLEDGYCPGDNKMIEMALMGDPTLRLYPIAPASDLRVYPNQVCSNTPVAFVCTPAPGVASLSWVSSSDAGVIGYNLYKTDPAHPSWTRVNQQLITGTSYADTSSVGGNVDNTNYMLRAVKLQTTPSGSYYDASEGIFATTYACGLPNSLWACGPPPYCPTCNASGLVSAVSRKTHGSAGTFDINLPLTGPRGVECRSGGANRDYTMVFTLSNNLIGVANVSVAPCGSVSSSMIDGTDAHNYIVNLTNVCNAQYITVTLTGVVDATGVPFNASQSMGMLVGDVNGNGSVSNTDVTLVQGQVGPGLTTSRFRNDVNANGIISNVDVALVRAQVGYALPTPP